MSEPSCKLVRRPQRSEVNHQSYSLEICANSLSSALAAQRGGASRIHLCANLLQGGTTPSYATIALTREKIRLPLHVLIRPRTGDFMYSARDRETMCCDIEACVRLGCDGVAIGALQRDGSVDAVVCRELIESAKTMELTFHRAFDAARDQAFSLDALIALGFDRVLTSGGRGSAIEGLDNIAALANRAAGRIGLMAAGGICCEHLGVLASRGVREFHTAAGAPRVSKMRRINYALREFDVDWSQTSISAVRHFNAALLRVAEQ